jgi:hypothetical protein
MAASPTGRFNVEAPAAQLDQARRLADVATAAGKRVEFVRWLREVNYRLAHEADEWGESRDTYPGRRIEDRVGMVGDLTVWYSIDFPRAIVYVKEFRLRDDPGTGEEA